MVELVGLLCADVRRFAADNVPDDPARAVYRIYRDTRFSNDKTPYKTHVAANFPRRGLPKHAGAGFYFHISPKEVGIAGGVYMPGPDELRAIRRVIVEQGPALRKLLDDRSLCRLAGALQGESLTRVPKGYDAACAEADLLRFKQLYFWVTFEPEAALKPGLRKLIASRFEVMTPVIHFLNNALLAATADPIDDRPKRPEPMF